MSNDVWIGMFNGLLVDWVFLVNCIFFFFSSGHKMDDEWMDGNVQLD